VNAAMVFVQVQLAMLSAPCIGNSSCSPAMVLVPDHGSALRRIQGRRGSDGGHGDRWGEIVAGIGCLGDGAVPLEGAKWRGSWLSSFW
jgi:hypothetical protein